jgi:hypothetical protein
VQVSNPLGCDETAYYFWNTSLGKGLYPGSDTLIRKALLQGFFQL